MCVLFFILEIRKFYPMFGVDPPIRVRQTKKGAWFPKRPDFVSSVVRRIAFIGAKNRAKITRFLALLFVL